VRAEAIAKLNSRTRTISATARSPRGEVTVTATADGTVTDVHLSQGTRLPVNQLAALIVPTIAAAQQAAARAAIDLAQETLGDSGYVDLLRSRVDERFGPDHRSP
jgi:pyruvate/2-oxoglutarate dehydrogenase complex dihydrolipoamide acyltransferase (E2) component